MTDPGVGSAWSECCKRFFRTHLPDKAPRPDVVDMVSQIASLATSMLSHADRAFEWLEDVEVACASPQDLAVAQLEPLTDLLEVMTRVILEDPERGTGESDLLTFGLMDDVAEMYCTPIGRLAEWQVTQYELMLPQADAAMVLVPWSAFTKFAVSSGRDLGMLTLFALMESMISATIVNSEGYVLRIMPLLEAAVELFDVDQELFRQALRPTSSPGLGSPVELANADALLQSFLNPQRAEVFAQVAATVALASAAKRRIVMHIATEKFAAGLPGVLQQTLDGHRSSFPVGFDVILHISLGTHVRGEPWRQGMRELDGVPAEDLHSAIEAAMAGPTTKARRSV